MFSSISRLWNNEGPRAQYSATDPKNDLPAATSICELENDPDKRVKTLRHLIKLNHSNFALVDEKLAKLNSIPDILAAAVALQCAPGDLDRLYESETEHDLATWTDSPGEVSKDDWVDFLGQKRFQRAFLDFFEDEVVEMGYHWRELAVRYLHFGECPLIQDAMCAGGRPLTRLAYGLALSSREVTMEGLALLAISQCGRPKSAEETTPTVLGHLRNNKDPVSILSDVAQAKRHAGEHFSPSEIVERFTHSWHVDSIAESVRNAQLTAALLFDRCESIDAGFADLSIATYGLAVALAGAPRANAEFAVLSWWRETLNLYIKAGCPKLDIGEISNPPGNENSWHALTSAAMQLKSDTYDNRHLLILHSLYSAAQSSPEPDIFLTIARRMTLRNP